MKHFYIIYHPVKDRGHVMTDRIANYLTEHGAVCTAAYPEESVGGNFRYSNIEHVPAQTECVLVVGGDGTFIQAVRDLIMLDVPFFGINLGTLGYLAEADDCNLESCLDALLADEFHVEKRMMVTAEVLRAGVSLFSDHAMNDVILSRRGNLQVFHYRIYVNGEFLSEFPADGIIAATPTGSTAYSYSAGGPIVMPQASLIVISPICAHTMNARSIIVPAEAEIEIEVGDREVKPGSGLMISFDGDSTIDLRPGDRVKVRVSERTVSIARISKTSFLETLRSKLR